MIFSFVRILSLFISLFAAGMAPALAQQSGLPGAPAGSSDLSQLQELIDVLRDDREREACGRLPAGGAAKT
ncbi:hypothetical protein [Ensifer adhaerens]|uniref:hypothetical protein n=1 Tax=Ensifer adhaerens TaxID=106592 RepID=UPI001319D34F|nr:hypothetical protein [Ensifer adhaerens]